MTKDEFKRATQKEVGPGGMKCACCAPAPGKERKELKRRARRRMKQKFNSTIKKVVDTTDEV
jgi:hypothetical protein